MQLWGRDRVPLLVTMQPYSGFDLGELYEWSASNKFVVTVSAESSWHYPGRTMLLEVMTPKSRRIVDGLRGLDAECHRLAHAPGAVPRLRAIKGGKE
jgi:hypothetical protein